MRILRNEHGDRCRDLEPDPDICPDCGQLYEVCACPEPLDEKQLTLDKTESASQWFDELEAKQDLSGVVHTNGKVLNSEGVVAEGGMSRNDSRKLKAPTTQNSLCSGETAGEDVCVPASPAPLLLRYPVWDMTFSQYGERNGWGI